MKKILKEAIASQYKKTTKLQSILKETISNPVFNKYKKFENEIEMQLHEGLSFGRGPAMGAISLGAGGTGLYGEHTKALATLYRRLEDAKMTDFAMLNDMARNIQNVMTAADPVIDLLDSEKPAVKEQANILVYKVYMYLKNMLELVVEASKNLRGKLPSGFEAAGLQAIKAAGERARKAEEELAQEEELRQAQEKVRKGEGGVFSRAARAIKGLFEEDLASLNEGLMSDLLNPGNGKLDKYTSKVDAFIDEAIETCDELTEEGNSLLEEDFYRLPQAGERSRLILEMIGLIKKFKCDLENIPWQLRQRMG
jgi:hypothetical protein